MDAEALGVPNMGRSGSLVDRPSIWVKPGGGMSAEPLNALRNRPQKDMPNRLGNTPIWLGLYHVFRNAVKHVIAPVKPSACALLPF